MKMPKLKWNEYDFVECLGVLPEIDETWHRWHKFKVEKDNLILKVDVGEYQNLVYVELLQKSDSEPLFYSLFFIREAVIYHNETNLNYLILSDCLIALDEHTYSDDKNIFDKIKFPGRINFEIYTFPKIKLKFS
jgi:hypothetical protein